MTSAEILLSVRGLRTEFVSDGRPPAIAVNDLSFDVKRGETLGIVGESGCGKSMTALSLMRLVPRPNGRIAGGSMLLAGRDLRQLTDAEMRQVRGQEISMIFQEPMTSLNPVLTIGQQIAETVMVHEKLPWQACLTRALDMLKAVKMPEAERRLHEYPHQLSGGMRQRVMIAMALACRPRLLLADEPTTALDVTIQAQILQLIRQLQQEMQMGVIFITHDMGVVAEVADRVLVMYRGEKVEEGASVQVFGAPRHRYTQALLSAVPQLGSMRDTDYPAHFALTLMDDAPAPEKKKMSAHDSAPNQLPYRTRPPILKVQDLVTRFDVRSGIFNRVTRKVHAVEQVSFNLYPGETLALVGESGCGKSTLGRSLLRLVDAQSGRIEFDGLDVVSLKHSALQALRRNIQFVFQDPFASLDPRLTVGFSIMEPLLVHGVATHEQARQRVADLLQRVGLAPDMAQRYPHEFSGGQRQRICIARALALNPKVVISDESVSALDVSIQAQIINLLIDLQRELGVAFLFISHDMAVVERISHRVAVMYLGQIVEIGPRRAIFQNPQHPYTRKLMSAVPIADPNRRHLSRELLSDEVPSPIRRLDDEPLVEPLVCVGPDHYVARHKIGGMY